MQAKIYDGDKQLKEDACAGFKVCNSWVYFNAEGKVWVEEWDKVIPGNFSSVGEAISWVHMYGDRD